jgi:hypothetical protein
MATGFGTMPDGQDPAILRTEMLDLDPPAQRDGCVTRSPILIRPLEGRVWTAIKRQEGRS